LLGLVCIVGSVLHAAWARRAMAGLALLLSGLGIAAAIYQHEGAAKLASCDLTLADKVVNALGLESLWPAMFQVTASCADAHVTMLGLPYERWSLALFSIVALVSLTLLRWPKYRR
jgi:disulfide bond formation protein DsbB